MRVVALIAAAACVLACTKRDSKTAEPNPTETKEAQVTPTDDAVETGILTEEVTYQSGDTKLTGYVAWDSSQKGPRPGVLVVHEWWGHGDYVRMRARMLARLGYTALALDMYGDGKYADHPDDAMKFMNEAISNMDVAEARFRAAYDLLKEHGTTDPNAIAAVGYCFGGAVVLHMARFGVDLDGVVSFHGNLATQAPAKKGAVKSKVLVLHGAEDPLVPPEQVDGFKHEMESAEVDYQFIAYPGAKHAFTNEAATAKGKALGMPLAYDENADKQSWDAMTKFLEEVFPPR
ncbi:MAG: dienelactone hydrolase family protein [Myxococcota bacterium]